MEATEEENYTGCDGADPRCRLGEAIFSLPDGIIPTTAGAVAKAVRSTATVTMLMPVINVVAVHWVGGIGG